MFRSIIQNPYFIISLLIINIISALIACLMLSKIQFWLIFIGGLSFTFDGINQVVQLNQSKIIQKGPFNDNIRKSGLMLLFAAIMLLIILLVSSDYSKSIMNAYMPISIVVVIGLIQIAIPEIAIAADGVFIRGCFYSWEQMGSMNIQMGDDVIRYFPKNASKWWWDPKVRSDKPTTEVIAAELQKRGYQI
ncbi:hypothetical protein K8I31_14425 [bacterium]|nr:hypothetical protein [bacterium]